MSLAIKTDRKGRWVKGVSGNPSGLRGRSAALAHRPAYIGAMIEECTLDEWRAITRQAIADAIKGKASARNWLSSYILGPPGAYSQQQDDTLPLGAETKIVRLTAIIESAIVSNEGDVIDVTPAE